jgi:heptosyltransferase II
LAATHKILLIQTAFIGDVILATALIEKLHQSFPDAQIDFMLRKGNESLLQGHPYLRKVWVWDKKKGKYRQLWQLLKQIRQESYHQVINLQRFASTGWFTAFSGAKFTTGFDKNPFSFLFTHRIRHQIGEGTHEVERNLSLIRQQTDTTFTRPRLYPSAHEYEAVRMYQQHPYICIAPTSVWFTKQFPADQWVRLLNQVPSNYTVYLLGSPQDREACEAILNKTVDTNHQRRINLAGKLTLLASAALMQGAVLNYVNDSAPMHLCSALNAPTCAIFCSTVPAFGFGPLADFSRVVEIEYKLYCRPCGLHGYRACPEKHFKCAYDIPTSQLIEVLKEAEVYQQNKTQERR